MASADDSSRSRASTARARRRSPRASRRRSRTSPSCASRAARCCRSAIRELVKDPALEVDPRAEALLYAAARAQLVSEKLLPLLAAGRDVLLDRFVDSSLAYQGAGRGLGVEEIAELNRFATAGWSRT